MYFGAPAKSIDALVKLKQMGFDFAEIIINNSTCRRSWWESEIKSCSDFFLLAHGPLEDHCDDCSTLWNHYVPTLKLTIDILARMEIFVFTIHFNMSSSVAPSLLAEKQKALQELIQYSRNSDVQLCVENTFETLNDLELLHSNVSNLCHTLDIGHANLIDSSAPSRIIERFGAKIRHLHIHDNFGTEDLHLPPGQGNIDFISLFRVLNEVGYKKTCTLEIPEASLLRSKNYIQSLLDISTK